ncbi:hypothetical protein HDE_12240 [Halotydeus destructor]|nr:hypothetical protein HDE_12240 [Halotydeus destructor]
MSKRKKFSIDTGLAVQVDKLNRELEESKAREEQLGKLADDMIQVISNYQLEVSKKDAAIAEMKREIDKYRIDEEMVRSVEFRSSCSSPVCSEVTSSGIYSALSQNATDIDSKTNSPVTESKLQLCLTNIQLMASKNRTLLSLRHSGTLTPPLQNYVCCLMRPTKHVFPSNHEKKVQWMKRNLGLLKDYALSAVQVNELNQFEENVVTLLTSLLADDLTGRESHLANPLEKTELAPYVSFKERFGTKKERENLFLAFLEEMTCITTQDETISELFKRRATLSKLELQAMKWLRNPGHTKSTEKITIENVMRKITENIAVLSLNRMTDQDKLFACRDRLIALLREKEKNLENKLKQRL